MMERENKLHDKNECWFQYHINNTRSIINLYLDLYVSMDFQVS
jgi:hypothetical protein